MAIAETMESPLAKLRVGPQKVLFVVAWCRMDEKELSGQFPEVWVLHVTCQLNNGACELGITPSLIAT